MKMGSKVISLAARSFAEDAERARVAVDELEPGGRVGRDGRPMATAAEG